MNFERRNFLRSILGVATATALPSEVWPFRKIFLPAQPLIYAMNFSGHVVSGKSWQEVDRKLKELNDASIEHFIPNPVGFSWETNQEQNEAWRRKFKQYGLV